MPKGIYPRNAGATRGGDAALRARIVRIGATEHLQRLLTDVHVLTRAYPFLLQDRPELTRLLARPARTPQHTDDDAAIAETNGRAERPLRPQLSAMERARISQRMQAAWTSSKTKTKDKKHETLAEINPKTGKPYKVSKSARVRMARSARRRASTPKGRAHMLKMRKALVAKATKSARARKATSSRVATSVRADTARALRQQIKQSTRQKLSAAARQRWATAKKAGLSGTKLLPGVTTTAVAPVNGSGTEATAT